MSDVRQLLLKNARAELSERDQRWLDDNQHRIVWHVLGLDELLLFLELPERERDLFKRLSSYLRNAGPDRPFIDQHGRVPMSFRSYLATKYQRHMGQSRVGLFETVQRVMDDVNRYFSQPSIEP